MKRNLFAKVLSVMLVLIMVLSLVACGGSGEGNSGKPVDGETNENGKEHVTITMYTQETPKAGTTEMIEALNEYLNEKLFTTLDLRLESDYRSKMGTRIDAGDEDWDICLIGPGIVDLQTYAKRNAFAPLDDYLDMLPGTTGQLIEGGIDSFSVNGTLYGVPILKDMFVCYGWTLNQSLLDDLGVKFPEDYATKWDIVDFLYEVKEKRDEKYPDDEDYPLVKDIFYDYDQWFVSERLVGGFNQPMVDVNISEEHGYKDIPMNDTVFCPVYTQEYRDLMKLVRELVEDGIGAFDPKTFDSDNYLLNSGKLLGSCGSGLISVSEDQNPNFKSAYYPSSVCYAADYIWGFAVNAKSKNVERAVEVLEFIQNDTYAATVMHYGKEGSGWTDTNQDGVIELTEKNSDPSNRWHYSWYGWTLGGVTAMMPIPGMPSDYMAQMKELNKTAEGKPNRGFKFDSTPVENEIAALNNVFSQYQPVLQTGQNANVDQLIDEFIAKLKANGMDKVIAECQKQLDEWRAANGKK